MQCTTVRNTAILTRQRLGLHGTRPSIAPSHRNMRRLSTNVPSSSSSSNNAIATTHETALANPIDFDTSSSIQGEESQILQVQLRPNQVLRAESGAMLFMTQGVEMGTSLGAKDDSISTTTAISDGFKRMLTGQNMFLSDYTYTGKEGTSGTVALGTDFPSKVVRFSLPEYGNKIICQKGAYLASSMDVDIQMEFTKNMTSGFFGGEGFILQKLQGTGDVFVKAGGALIRKELEEGETLRASSGSLVAFTQDVQFDVQTMPGFKNVMFGGEGLFVTSLTGPGTVWLQGMPPDRMISEIARKMPSGGGIGLGIPIGMGGGGGGGEGAVDGAGTEEGSGDADGQSAEELVAATDAATEMDRNATVAASGMGMDTVDSESASSLFGDAVPNESPENTPFDDTSTMPEMDDATSFSTQDTDFADDLTQEQQFDDFQQDETSFTDEASFTDETSETSYANVVDSGDEGGGVGDILGQFWDFFNDD